MFIFDQYPSALDLDKKYKSNMIAFLRLGEDQWFIRLYGA